MATSDPTSSFQNAAPVFVHKVGLSLSVDLGDLRRVESLQFRVFPVGWGQNGTGATATAGLVRVMQLQIAQELMFPVTYRVSFSKTNTFEWFSIVNKDSRNTCQVGSCLICTPSKEEGHK